MRRNESITHIMTSNITSVNTAQKISDVYAVLENKAVHHVPVTSGQKLVGMISSTDMVKLSLGPYGTPGAAKEGYLDGQFSIEGVMSTDLTTLQPDNTIRDAAEVLVRDKFHALPVVEDSGKLVGMVTTTDLIRYLLDQY